MRPTPYTIRLPPALRLALQTLADKDERPLSQYVIRALRAHIAKRPQSRKRKT